MIEGGSEAPVNQSTEPDTALKIPEFLDCNVTANATTVVYDNLTLKDVKGSLNITDGKAKLNNMTSSIFDGNLSLNGLVDTTKEQSTFKMQLGASNFNISESFNGLDMLQALAPIAKALEGKLNSSIDISGTLGQDFTPILNTISGDAFAELLTGEFKPKNEQLFTALENKLSFLDFSKLNLKDLTAKLSFNNGQVNVQPFDIKYKDIKMTIGGSHSFSNTMNYQVVIDVPAKYLGSDVNALINKINDPAVNNITIPVTASVSGNTTKPQVSTDLTSGVKTLTQQLVEIQKQKLINQGKGKLNDAIGNILNNNNQSSDSTSTTTNNPVKDVIGGLLGGNKPKDSTKTDSTKTKNNVKDVLGGLFGKKKKSD